MAHLQPPAAPEPPSFRDPEFVRACDWLARAPAEPRAVVVGAPFGGGSISGARCDLTPAALRRSLARFSVWSSEHGVSLETLPVLDAGDVEAAAGVEETQARIAEAVSALPRVPLVVIGGDNSITVGAARGAGATALLTFDAHHDCRDPAVKVTNGSPVRQLVDGGIGSVVQIGINGFANAEAHARWALDHKVHVVLASRIHDGGIRPAIDGALRILDGDCIWADFDLDVLDRAYAPGAPASMPGGLTPIHLTEAAFLLGREPRVAGIDLTEVDPSQDVADTTVRAACAVMLSYLAGVASR
jgi:formiminoglutamase